MSKSRYHYNRPMLFFVWVISVVLAFSLGIHTANANQFGGHGVPNTVQPGTNAGAPVAPQRDMLRDAQRGIFNQDKRTVDDPDQGEWQSVPVPQGDLWKSQPPLYNDKGWEK